MKAVIILSAGVLIALTLASQSYGQTTDTQLFDGARTARAAAQAADAPTLSPKNWARALSALEDAESDLAKGKSIERVQRNLTSAELGFRTAHDNAIKAADTFQTSLQSRAAASAAEAERLVPDELAVANKQLVKAIAKLERDDVENAALLGSEADNAFRQAELNALRIRYLATARNLIAEASGADANKLAPRTFAQANQLLGTAEAELVADRYAADKVRRLAARAESEARHSIYLSGLAKLVGEKTLTTEDIILNWETTLAEIAATLSIDADLSTGPTETRDKIVNEVETLLELPAIVAEQRAQILGLEDELREQDERIASTSADRASLIRQVERQARIREQFRQIRDTFREDEAIVLRDGDDVIIRLVGLTFSSNSAELAADIEPMMNKVKSAIEVFPQCNLKVEGHTDSKGNVAKNQSLSEQRAQAVLTYMTERLLIPQFRIKALGFGDSRPLTSNRSVEGRAQNRRIDLVITPSPQSL
jgi:OOP family OmpA-OmpF porin